MSYPSQSTTRASLLVLVAALALAGCEKLPTDAPDALTPPTQRADAPPKGTFPGGSAENEYVGPMPSAWVEPSDQLLQDVAAGNLTPGPTGLSEILQGLDLALDSCVDPAEVVVRVSLVENGVVTAATSSDPGVLFTSPGEEIVAGGGSEGSQGQGACSGSVTRYAGWGAQNLDPAAALPPAFAWPKQWITGVEMAGAPAFLKAKKAFLKAKKAFVPAAVSFRGSRDWFPENDTPILVGGFADEAPAAGPAGLDGPVVVIGVMPGDNVSVMPGDNATSPQKAGTLFIALGPDD